MLKSYLVIALRGLRQRKLYTAINVAGLAVGLACCLLLVLYLQHELSYDRFHAKAERIYRIVSDWETPSEKRRIMSPGALAPALQADFPEVVEVVRTAPARHLVAKGDRQFQEDGMLYADASLFRVFDFELLKGDAKTSLAGVGRSPRACSGDM